MPRLRSRMPLPEPGEVLGLRLLQEIQLEVHPVDIAVAAAAEGRQVLHVARTLGVMPDRIDMVGVQSVLSAANNAGESVPFVDLACVARRPGSDELSAVGDTALPEVRGMTRS